MIGRWLEEQEAGRLNAPLTTAMRPGSYVKDALPGGGPCLMGCMYPEHGSYMPKAVVLAGSVADLSFRRRSSGGHACNLEFQYDELCRRFGTERVNAAIRSRILSIKAQRALSAPTVAEPLSRDTQLLTESLA
jgi:hypothetical protein